MKLTLTRIESPKLAASIRGVIPSTLQRFTSALWSCCKLNSAGSWLIPGHISTYTVQAADWYLDIYQYALLAADRYLDIYQYTQCRQLTDTWTYINIHNAGSWLIPGHISTYTVQAADWYLDICQHTQCRQLTDTWTYINIQHTWMTGNYEYTV